MFRGLILLHARLITQRGVLNRLHNPMANDTASIFIPSTVATAVLTVLALLAFATNSVLARLGLGASAIDSASYTTVRLVSGAAALWVIVSLSSQRPLYRPAGSWASAAMLFLYAATFSFAYLSLSTGTGALILFASVQITMIAVGLWLGERPRIFEWIGLAVAIAGLIYLVSPGITAPSLSGSFLMFIAGVGWGVYSIRGRGNSNPAVATADNFLRTLPMTAVLMLFGYRQLAISGSGVLYAILSGAISSGVGYAIWYAALQGLTATRAATVQLSVPVIAAIGGVVFLSEPVTARLLLSSVVILAGVGMAISARAIPSKSST